MGGDIMNFIWTHWNSGAVGIAACAVVVAAGIVVAVYQEWRRHD